MLQVGLKFVQVGPKLVQGRPKLARGGPKLAQVGSNFGSDCPNLGARWPKSAPSWSKLVDQVGQNSHQVAPKLGKNCSKMAQMGTKITSRLSSLKHIKSRGKNNEFSCLQCPVLVQNGVVECHLGSKLTDFAPKLAKVGAKLVHVGHQVGVQWLFNITPKIGWLKSHARPRR